MRLQARARLQAVVVFLQGLQRKREESGNGVTSLISGSTCSKSLVLILARVFHERESNIHLHHIARNTRKFIARLFCNHLNIAFVPKLFGGSLSRACALFAGVDRAIPGPLLSVKKNTDHSQSRLGRVKTVKPVKRLMFKKLLFNVGTSDRLRETLPILQIRQCATVIKH